MSACPGNVCRLDKTEIVLTGPSTSVQSYHAWSIINYVRTLNMSPRQTKPTILQWMYDQQRLGSVCALTHYIKQASWIALSPQKVHTVWSSKGLIRMCYCSRTVDPALGSPAIEGKYDLRMLWSECAVAQTHPSIRLSHKTFCYIQRLQEVHLISEGSDQTTDVQLRVTWLFVQILLLVLPYTHSRAYCLCKP